MEDDGQSLSSHHKSEVSKKAEKSAMDKKKMKVLKEALKSYKQ